MPFTASHPAAILPVACLPKKYVCLTGLIVGSLTPDFEYFFRMEARSVFSHTTGGLFYFCLPVGLFLCFLFHNIVRDAFIDSLPRFLKARFYGIRHFSWNGYFVKRWFAAIPSILLGAWTHVFWDSFTHGPLRIYQHPSTVVGAVVILAAIWRMPKKAGFIGGINIKYWLVFTILWSGIMAICVSRGLRLDLDAAFRVLTDRRLDVASYNNVSRVVVSSISAGLISVTVTSSVWNIFFTKKESCND